MTDSDDPRYDRDHEIILPLDAVDCALLIKNIGHYLEKRANADLAGDDITVPQLRFLTYLHWQEDGSAPFKDVERFYRVSQPTAAGIFKRLESKGYITTATNPADHRSKVARLTPDGRDLVERHDRFRQDSERMLLGPLSPEERAAFVEMLERVSMGMSEDRTPHEFLFED